jgi:hypothetical protein
MGNIFGYIYNSYKVQTGYLAPVPQIGITIYFSWS